jgi:hypothetical protein
MQHATRAVRFSARLRVAGSMVENHASACLRLRQRFRKREEWMETMVAVSAFLGAALVGRAGDSRIGGYLDEYRWLRATTFAVVFFVIGAILTGM